MKKIYTLLAAACISTAAFAGFDPTVRYEAKRLQNVDLKELIAKQGNFEFTSTPKGMQKILNMNDQSEWATMISIMGKVTDLYTFKDENTGLELTFEQFPYYDMIVSMQPVEQNAKGIYIMEVLWPAYGALDEDLYDKATGSVDVEKCKAKYKENALQPYSQEDFVKANGNSGLLFTMPGFYVRPCIVGPEAFYNAQTGQFMGQAITNADGKECYLKSAEIIQDPDGNKVDFAGATTIDWKAFDKDSSQISLQFDGKFSSVVGGPQTSTQQADLEGEAVILGFNDILWDTIGEVHIFNGGPQKFGDEWTWNYENAFEGTLNFYYLAMCDETVTYNAITEDGEYLYNYEEDSLPANESSSGSIMYGAPSYPLVADTHYIYLAGALWAPENSQPYGKWEMKMPEMETVDNRQKYKQIPEAYNLVVYTNEMDGTQDGFHGSYEGYTQPGVPESCFIGIGDKTNGLNFLFGSSMNYGHYIYGTFKGDIMLHNTPNKWRSDITKLPAVANEDADYVGEWSGVESVMEESNAPVVSRSFYNFQGQRLSSEPENGMYIIRSVKADGTVKAEKVAK